MYTRKSMFFYPKARGVFATLFFMLLLLMVVPATHGQSTKQHLPARDLQDPIAALALDSGGTAKVRSLPKVVLVTAVAAGTLVGTFALIDEPVQKFSQLHRNQLEDHVARIVEPLGHVKYYVVVAGAAAAGSFLAENENLQKVGVLTLASVMTSAVATAALKNAFHRHRPSSTSDNHIFDGPVNEAFNTSLPSSHTATAFAAATSVAAVYQKDHAFVAPVAYGLATLVGLSRINDNAHWASDVMAGAVVGYLSAKSVNFLYGVAEQKLKNKKLLISPQLGAGFGSVSAALTF